MKKYLTILFGFLLAPSMAFAVTISTGGVSLILPSTGDSYGLHTSSLFDTLTINSGSFVFSMSADQTVTVMSADRRPFTTDQTSATIACNGDQSSAYYKATGAATFTITPGTGTCSSTSSGGGGSPSVGAGGGGSYAPTVGGGGGGGSSLPPSPPAAQILPQVPATVVAQPSAVAQVASPVFNRDLSIGARNNDVTRLQLLLAQDKSVYPEGTVSGYYGKLTQAAVRAFQLKYGVIKSTMDQGNGRVGPKTRARLNEVFGGSAVSPAPTQSQSSIEALQAQIKALQAQIQSLIPVPVPLAPSLVPPPPPSSNQVPSWMQLQSVPRAGGASVVDPAAGSVAGGDVPDWMKLTPAQ